MILQLWIWQVIYLVNVQTLKFIIAPTLEKLKGHIALGSSVRPSIQNFR